MEHSLRCNSLKCRKDLKDHAVVTTCSHIFCLDCSNQLQLSNTFDGQHRKCPACEAPLLNPDDAVITNLNPTEDYKTSVLSGLSPNIIMECAGRALSFWAYQTTQEIVYQQFLARSLTDKYSALNTQMQKTVHDAHAEISDLRNRLDNMEIDQDNLRRKNDELAQAYGQKSRLHNQTQELYDKLKRKAMLGQVQTAALDAVDYAIQPSAISTHYGVRGGSLNHGEAQLDPFPDRSQIPSISSSITPSFTQPPAVASQLGDTWAGFGNQRYEQGHNITLTPSSHRQRLSVAPTPGRVFQRHQSHHGLEIPNPQGRPPQPRRLAENLGMNKGANAAFAGYGLSAGLKVSHPAGFSHGANTWDRPTIRSRVAQRPNSASVGAQKTTVGRSDRIHGGVGTC